MDKLSATPDRLAIGVAGGFQVDKEKFNVEKSSSLIVMPEMDVIPLPCLDLPEIVIQVIKAVQVNSLKLRLFSTFTLQFFVAQEKGACVLRRKQFKLCFVQFEMVKQLCRRLIGFCV